MPGGKEKGGDVISPLFFQIIEVLLPYVSHSQIRTGLL
jgi:hypothetical protein